MTMPSEPIDTSAERIDRECSALDTEGGFGVWLIRALQQERNALLAQVTALEAAALRGHEDFKLMYRAIVEAQERAKRAEAQVTALREENARQKDMLHRAATWPSDDVQGLRYHCLVAATK